MTFDWSCATVGDFVDLQRGNTYQSKLLDTPGPVLLGLASIERDGGFRADKLRTYGGDSPAKLLVYPGDMYVSLKDVTQSGDLLGSVARVPTSISIGRMTQDTVKLIFKNELIDRSYLYWVLRSPEYREYCRARGMGTTNLSLSRDDFLSFPVPEPTDTRISIQRTLDAIEERISLNRHINQTLEAMAQAIFKSWFVDFDPVKAKIAAIEQGQDPLRAAMRAISGKTDAEIDQMPREHHDQLAAIAELFPDAMEESELGEIPKGWKCMKTGDFVERLSVGKKFDQKSAHSEGLVPILDQGRSGIIGFHDEAPGVKASLEKPVAVFANHTCYMRLITFDFSAIQNVLPFCGKDVDTVWAFYATKNKVKFSEYKGHWPDFVLFETVVPEPDVTRHFRRVIQPLVSKTRMLELESEKLVALRDTLLPRLLSGELSVDLVAEENMQ